MKKIIYLLVIVSLLLPLASCGGKNPFKKLNKIESSFHMNLVLEYNMNTYEQQLCDYEYFVEYKDSGCLTLLTGTEFGVKQKIYGFEDQDGSYTYTYNFETGKYAYSFTPEDHESTDDNIIGDYFANLFNEDNYDYDKKAKQYKIKDTIDLGNIYDAVCYIEGDDVVIRYKLYQQDGSETYEFTATMKINRINEDFNLELPRI